eukprot:CCRYP_017391-RA/>CCRYP_017391-RA protein AED:0.38 eAED:0.38 QI:0/0/0/1/1/1/2/0/219
MVRPKYMRLKVLDIPEHIIAVYKIDKLTTTDGYVYALIQKGHRGIPVLCGVVDCTMLPALGSLDTQQSVPTQNTLLKIHHFLDYAMTHPDAMITYRTSNMILAVHSDAFYLSETKAHSRAGGHIFLSENDPSPRNNGAMLILAQIIKPVMSSAAKAELGALYINAREVIPQRHLLNELGHPQPPTPIQINNSTAIGVVTNIIQPQHQSNGYVFPLAPLS